MLKQQKRDNFVGLLFIQTRNIGFKSQDLSIHRSPRLFWRAAGTAAHAAVTWLSEDIVRTLFTFGHLPSGQKPVTLPLLGQSSGDAEPRSVASDRRNRSTRSSYRRCIFCRKNIWTLLRWIYV